MLGVSCWRDDAGTFSHSVASNIGLIRAHILRFRPKFILVNQFDLLQLLQPINYGNPKAKENDTQLYGLSFYLDYSLSFRKKIKDFSTAGA
jgi:hypothetical protein